MRRIIDKGGEPTNAILTDDMIDSANEIVSQHIHGKETRERTCNIWDASVWHNRFSISCETSSDYQDYKFRIGDDGYVVYEGMEGDWK